MASDSEQKSGQILVMEPLFFEQNEKIQAERRQHVRLVTASLTVASDALQAARLDLEEHPNSNTERIVAAVEAMQRTVLLLLSGFQSLRDFGIQGALRYPGLSEWFDSPEAKRVIGEDHG